VVLMLYFALTGGYKAIWPLFGATNQLLAAITLIAITVWLHRAGKAKWYTLGPAVVMLVTTIAALIYKLVTDYLPNGKILLATTDILLLALAAGVIGLSVKRFGVHPSTRSG
jgi:carbon starvation protein